MPPAIFRFIARHLLSNRYAFIIFDSEQPLEEGDKISVGEMTATFKRV
jgi:hypothetical protein